MIGPILRKRAVTYSPGWIWQWCYLLLDAKGDISIIEWI